MSIYQDGSGDDDTNEHNDFDLNDIYLEYDDIDEAFEDHLEYDDIETYENDADQHMQDTLHDAATAHSNLTTHQLDILAVKLGVSWKRFARMTKLFSEGEIYDVECSCHSMYEKSYQMIMLWGSKSKEAITVSMVTDILMLMQRNDLARELIGDGLFSLPICDTPTVPHQIIDCLCSRLDSSWKRYARQTAMFSEVEINNIDEEEPDLYEKCHKMVMLWQEKSISTITLDDIKCNLLKIKEGLEEKVIRYTVDNGNDIRKIKVRAHHALEKINKELMNVDKNLSLLKVQYIDSHCNGDMIITCDNETQLDLAIFDENVTDFNVVTKRKWWIFFNHHVHRP